MYNNHILPSHDSKTVKQLNEEVKKLTKKVNEIEKVNSDLILKMRQIESRYDSFVRMYGIDD